MKFWRLPLDSEAHSIPHGIVSIIQNRCKGCGFCIEFCPNGCLKQSKGFNPRVTTLLKLFLRRKTVWNAGCVVLYVRSSLFLRNQRRKENHGE